MLKMPDVIQKLFAFFYQPPLNLKKKLPKEPENLFYDFISLYMKIYLFHRKLCLYHTKPFYLLILCIRFSFPCLLFQQIWWCLIPSFPSL